MTDQEYIAWLERPDSILTLLVETSARIDGVETALLLSNRNYTLPDGTYYQGIIQGGIEQTEGLSLTGQASISFGTIELNNTAGVRDGWLEYIWQNRAITVKLGDMRWPAADFRLIFDGVVSGLDKADTNTLSLTLLDKLARLNNPITEQTLGGDTDNKDRLIPFAAGENHNVTPLLIDPANLVYQLHDGEIAEIGEVRDNGVPVLWTDRYTVEGVETILPSGQFALVTKPAGTITVSLRGDAPGGVYSNTVAKLVQRLAVDYGPANSRFTPADIDTDNFAAFEAAHPQPVGYYAADRANVLDVCQQLAASVGASVTCTSTGKLRLVKLAVPAAGAPTDVSAKDMDADTLAITDRPEVKAGVNLGYCKAWTVQSSGLASGIPPENSALYAQEYLSVTTNNSATAEVYRLDTQPEQETTLLLVTADAEAEALRRLNLWAVQRNVYSARYRAHLLLVELGDPIRITHPRFGLSAGKTGTVTSIARDWLSGRVTIGVLA